MTNFKNIPHHVEEENMDAHNCNYHLIFNLSNKNVGCTFTLQPKHQYLETGSNLIGMLDDMFVCHSFPNLK